MPRSVKTLNQRTRIVGGENNGRATTRKETGQPDSRIRKTETNSWMEGWAAHLIDITMYVLMRVGMEGRAVRILIKLTTMFLFKRNSQ